jgi:hypothetical protein
VTRGGKREGAGAPSKGHRVRRAMVNLDAAHNTMLLELEDELRMSASDVLRLCIRIAYNERKGRGRKG